MLPWVTSQGPRVTVHRLTHSWLVCFKRRSHCESQATRAWNWGSFCLRITECRDYNCGNLHRLSPVLLSPSILWGEHQIKLPAINEQQGQGEDNRREWQGSILASPPLYPGCYQHLGTDFMWSPRVSNVPSYKCGKCLVIKVHCWSWRDGSAAKKACCTTMKVGVQTPAPLVSHTPISLARGGWGTGGGVDTNLGFISITESMTSRRNPDPKEYGIR